MKITPIATPGSATSQNAETTPGRSVSPERYARAVAAITGEAPQVTQPTPAQTEKPSVQRIKMITQRSVNRDGLPMQQRLEMEQKASKTVSNDSNFQENDQNRELKEDILDTNRQTEEADEATKPFSPQFAALAKAKRAAQAKQAEIETRERALAQQEADMKLALEKLQRLKSNPLDVLQEEGISYDQLTESVLNQGSIDPEVSALRQELQAMREEFAQQQQQRDQVSREQALRMIRKDVDALVSQGEDFETVREAGYAPQVVQLIERWYNETGDILETAQAARMVEDELMNEALRFAQLKKVRNRLTPEPQQQQTQQQTGQKPIMKTLTNRTGASAHMSARERAIAAFYGKL